MSKTAADLVRALGRTGTFVSVDGIDPAANGTAGALAKELMAKMGL